jgi:hypothetical protein
MSHYDVKLEQIYSRKKATFRILGEKVLWEGEANLGSLEFSNSVLKASVPWKPDNHPYPKKFLLNVLQVCESHLSPQITQPSGAEYDERVNRLYATIEAICCWMSDDFGSVLARGNTHIVPRIHIEVVSYGQDPADPRFFSDMLPIGAAFASLGYAGSEFIIPALSGSQQRQEQQQEEMMLIVFDGDSGDYDQFVNPCREIARCLRWRAVATTIGELGQANNEQYPSVLCCVGTNYMTDQKYQVLEQLCGNVKLAFLFQPRTASYIRTLEDYPLGYAQRIVECGVPRCFALSGHPTKEGIKRLLEIIAERLQAAVPAQPANWNSDKVAATVSSIVHSNEFLPARGNIGQRTRIAGHSNEVPAAGGNIKEHTKIAVMSVKQVVRG